MIHDLELTEKLSGFPPTRFEGTVFRVTSMSADPTAASITGGRWAPRPYGEPGIPVLYTSFDRDGAIAEVASYLAEQSPMPTKMIKVHELAVTTKKTLTLVWADLIQLGVDPDQYKERNSDLTQRIGAAIHFLGFDGLIAPSARWECNNLIIFADNHKLAERLEALRVEEIDWQAWVRSSGTLSS